MNICIITQNLYSLGGVQRVVCSIINKLSTKDNIQITVLMPFADNVDGDNLFTIDESISVVDLNDYYDGLNKKTRRLLFSINKWIRIFDNNIGKKIIYKILVETKEQNNLIRFINTEGFDVVIATSYLYSILLASLVNNIKSKTVGWQHNTFESYFETRGVNGFGLKALCSETFKKLNDVWVLTKADKIKFDESFSIRSKVLYNPIDIVEKKNGTDNKTTNLLFVGRLVLKQKGLDYLVEILARIKKVIPDFVCYVVGDGEDRTWLNKYVLNNGLKDNVIIVGQTNDVYSFYQDSSIMIQTSRWEGFGMTILEAMSMGLSVVAFENNGPNEIISDGIDGYLIDKFNIDAFCNKVIELMNNDSLRIKIGYNAINRSRDFSIENIIPKLIRYLND